MARSSNNAKSTAVIQPQTEASQKLESIKMAMEQIEKQYGRGSIMRFGDAAGKLDISVISTGCLPLDLALGVGGLPAEELLKFMVLRHRAKRRYVCQQLRKHKNTVGLPPLLMQNMH